MNKHPDNIAGITVQDPKTGEMVFVRGYGAMKDHPLDLDPRIDLTKPIYEQVLRLERLDARKAKKAGKS